MIFLKSIFASKWVLMQFSHKVTFSKYRRIPDAKCFIYSCLLLAGFICVVYILYCLMRVIVSLNMFWLWILQIISFVNLWFAAEHSMTVKFSILLWRFWFKYWGLHYSVLTFHVFPMNISFRSGALWFIIMQ